MSYKRSSTITFSGVLLAGAQNTYVSSKITFIYRIVHASVVFGFNTANLLRVYILTGVVPSASTTTIPSGTNIFSPYSPTPYLIGEGLIKCPPLDFYPSSDEVYVKIHAVNGSAVIQAVNVTVTVVEV